MLPEPLPTVLDVRKAAVRGAKIVGTLKPSDLRRFLPLVAEPDGIIRVEMEFAQDEERRYLLHVKVDADLVVTCQRCLDSMSTHMASESILAIVWNDGEAAHLPKYLDALVVEDSICDLWQVVEEELMLGLPPYSYHSKDDCKVSIARYSDHERSESAAEVKPNPFNVLEQLKPG